MNPLHKDFLGDRFPVLGALCVFLGCAFFSYSAVLDLDVKSLDGEGGLVEVLTAACLFLTSLLLFATAKLEKVRIRRGAYLLGSLVMAFSCGEEMNWGQHIFGFTAPGFVVGVHFSVHNTSIGMVLLRYLLRAVPLLLGILVCGALFARKDKLLGIPLPSVPLTFSFLLIVFPEYLLPDTRLWSILSGPGVLLMTAFLFMLFSGQVRHSIFTAALLTMPAASLYAGYRCDCNAWATHIRFSTVDEALECLLALACLFYAAELWRGERDKDGAKASRRLLRGQAAVWKTRNQDLPPPWLTASTLMVSVSFGLAASAHFSSKTTAVPFTEDLSKILAVKPVIRSEWEIRIMDNSLVYFKEPCKLADTYGLFSIRVYPHDPNDLPAIRKARGFEALGFSFLSQKGVISDGKCLVRRRFAYLDASAISHIKAGQSLRDEGRLLWEVEFSPDQ